MEIVVIAHNIRSTHNMGAILRTCDGFGVARVICSGYTPYPAVPGDERLPHIRDKITKQIHKTALGAEANAPIELEADLKELLRKLQRSGFSIVALEQSPQALLLPDYSPPQKVALLLGEEVHGIPVDILKLCDTIVEIPMHGAKESFNVSVATGIALYALRAAT